MTQTSCTGINFLNFFASGFITLHSKLNPICHLLALLEAHPIHHISRIRVKWKQSTFGCETLLTRHLILAHGSKNH
jgi:hypothetical protein